MSFDPSNSVPWGLQRDDSRSGVLVGFFNRVYLLMGVGLALTAVVSYLCAQSGFLIANPFVAVGAGLGLFALSWTTQSVALRISAAAGTAMFLAYSACMGVLISYVWLRYQLDTIGIAFGLTAGLFIVTSIVGFVAKVDLTKIGVIAGMIMLGLFAASLVNIFLGSPMLMWIVTYAIVVVVPLIIAYETQQLREFALANGGDSVMAPRVAVVGALILYVSFINLFMAILRIVGSRR